MVRKLLLCIGITFAAIGCTKEVETSQSYDNILRISSNIATRADKSTWADEDAIGVYMTSNTLGNYEENVKFTTSGDGNFNSDDPIYYPSEAVDIFAYYPWVDNVDLEKHIIDSEDQVDLLSATATDITQSSQAVAMTFDHLLSKVSLTIKAGTGLTTADLQDLVVTISGIGSKTTGFNLIDPTAEVTFEESNSLTLTTNDEGTSSSIIVIPQSLNGVKLTFTTTESKTFTTTLATTEFKRGMEYTYTATLIDNGVEITEANIDTWNSDNTVLGTANIVDIEYKIDQDKYYINSAKGFAAFRDLVNALASNTQNATFAGFEESAFAASNLNINGVLTLNIDITDVCGNSWSPIGYWVSGEDEQSYNGTFDGGGYEISGLNISTTANQQALFRTIGEKGIICNLGIAGSIKNSATSDTQLGGITAWNNGLIINCYSLVEIDGSNITNVGGIAAYNSETGRVVNCYNQKNVIGLVNIGGIVGQSEGYVGYCYNTGKVSTSTNLSNGSVISGTTSVIKYGGVVGWNNNEEGSDPQVKGSFCLDNTDYSIGQVALTTSSGTLNTNVCYSEYLTSESFATTMTNGAATYNETYTPTTTYTTACAWIYNSGGYPTLDFGVEKEYEYLDISYNSISYNINTDNGLVAFAALVNGTSMPDGIKTSGDDIYFNFGTAHPNIDGKLTDNISLEGVAWTPIGYTTSTKYYGSFDGCDKTISGVSYIISEDTDLGVFKYVNDANTITDIYLAD